MNEWIMSLKGGPRCGDRLNRLGERNEAVWFECNGQAYYGGSPIYLECPRMGGVKYRHAGGDEYVFEGYDNPK